MLQLALGLWIVVGWFEFALMPLMQHIYRKYSGTRPSVQRGESTDALKTAQDIYTSAIFHIDISCACLGVPLSF